MRRTSILTLAVALMGLGGIPAAQAAHSASATKALPNPCKSFTTKSVDKLMGLKSSVHPKRKLSTFNKGQPSTYNECMVTHGSKEVVVTFEYEVSGSGGGASPKTYAKPKLGKYGKIVEAKGPQGSYTSAFYEQHKVFVSDDYPAHYLKHHGKLMYHFALKQSKWVKKHA